jgi:hypothetical protein
MISVTATPDEICALCPRVGPAPQVPVLDFVTWSERGRSSVPF